MLVEANVSCAAFKNLSNEERSKLSETSQDLFHFLNQFAMMHKVTNGMKAHLIGDPIQNIEVQKYRK